MKDRQLLFLIGGPALLTLCACAVLLLPGMGESEITRVISYALITLAVAAPVIYFGLRGEAEKPKVATAWAVNSLAAYIFCGGIVFFFISAMSEATASFLLSMGVQALTLFVPTAAAVFAALIFWKVKHSQKPRTNKGKKK